MTPQTELHIDEERAREKSKKTVNTNSPCHQLWKEATMKLNKIKYVDEKRGEVYRETIPPFRAGYVHLRACTAGVVTTIFRKLNSLIVPI